MCSAEGVGTRRDPKSFKRLTFCDSSSEIDWSSGSHYGFEFSAIKCSDVRVDTQCS